MAYIETAHDLIDMESNMIPHFGSWYEDYKALHPSYSIHFASGVFYHGIIFGATVTGAEGAELCKEE
jgi:hypothetical protein